MTAAVGPPRGWTVLTPGSTLLFTPRGGCAGWSCAHLEKKDKERGRGGGGRERGRAHARDGVSLRGTDHIHGVHLWSASEQRGNILNFEGSLSEWQGHIVGMTVLYVPDSLDIGVH